MGHCHGTFSEGRTPLSVEQQEDLAQIAILVVALPYGVQGAIAATTLRPLNYLAIKIQFARFSAGNAIHAQLTSIKYQTTFVTHSVTVNPAGQSAIADFASGAVLFGPAPLSVWGAIGFGGSLAYQYMNSGP